MSAASNRSHLGFTVPVSPIDRGKAWAREPMRKQNVGQARPNRDLLLAMADFCTHTSLFSSYLASTFSSSLGTHLVQSPVRFRRDRISRSTSRNDVKPRRGGRSRCAIACHRPDILPEPLSATRRMGLSGRTRVHLAVCKVAISLRRDVARPNRFPMKSRLIVAGAWPNDLFDENKADGSPPRRAFVTAERDGYFLFPPANRKLHSAGLDAQFRFDSQSRL